MEGYIFDLSLVLISAGVLSFVAFMFKQPIILAYIICGVMIGPWGGGWVQDLDFIENISHLGITLLLFLAGLGLQPHKLFELFKKTSFVTFGTSAISFVMAFGLAVAFKFSMLDSFCIGLALMFSSTILVVKLLPTTSLHHERMGAVCVGVLILQDLLAVAVLAFIRCFGEPQGAIFSFAILSLKLFAFVGVLVALEYYVLRKIMQYVESLHELLFILGLSWCLAIATISNQMGLFYETGAFFAGVVLARHSISLFIAEKLSPLRDFFLVLFFFTLGAKLDFSAVRDIVLPTILLTGIFVGVKPWIFQRLFIIAHEKRTFAKEVGVRLGQLSEFSLLVALLALESGQMTHSAAQLVQLVTILTFVISSYAVVFNYPTPIGMSKRLMRD